MTCTVLPLVGTLAGVVIGALLTPYVTSRWQHRQWTLDNTCAEYRELLGVLAKSAHYVALSIPKPASVLTPEDQRQILVKKAFCFKLTNETRGADLGDIRDQGQLRGIVNSQSRSMQKSRIKMLGKKYF